MKTLLTLTILPGQMKARIKLFFGRFWWLKYKKVHWPKMVYGFEHNCKYCLADCEAFKCPCHGDEVLIERFHKLYIDV